MAITQPAAVTLVYARLSYEKLEDYHMSAMNHSFFRLSLLLVGGLLVLASCGETKTIYSGFPDSDTEAPRIPGDDAYAGAPDGWGKPDTLAPGQQCQPGKTLCSGADERFVCLPDGSAWVLEACPEGTWCQDGECRGSVCSPGQRECLESGNGYHQCNARGDGWGSPVMCGEDESCIDGVCLPVQCRPGDVVCSDDGLLLCTGDGLGWRSVPCEEGEVCFAGQCVECVNAAQCEPGEICSAAGKCIAQPVEITRAAPHEGFIDESYLYNFEARGGLEPYDWTLETGELPPGLALESDGTLAGTPTGDGVYLFTVEVVDQHGSNDSAQVSMTVSEYVEGVRITTPSPLPSAEEGSEYSMQLNVSGGTAPYAWMINDGLLPNGLRMDSTGLIMGVPNMDVGDFVFNVRVFDNSSTPTWDEKEFLLEVELAPLEIIGDREVDLLLTKVILLPLLTVIEGLPILPYNTKLEARGGLRPYHWTEVELPALLRGLISTYGLPEGLTLASDGTISGTVTSTANIFTLTIPFTEIELSGFFFMAEVRDSQERPESQMAVFLIPTVPIGI